MLRLSIVAVALVAFCAGTARADVVGAASSQGQIRSLLQAQARDWSAGNLDAFCAVYAKDATFVAPSGVTHTRAAILARYKKRYGTDKASMGKLTLDVEEVRLGPGGQTASAVLKWTLRWPGKPDASGHSLVVLHATKRGWLIVQDASM